jgi:AcrR family transcriptional regulator
VLDAAMRLFVEQGLGATTGASSRESGLSTGSLFNYFPTKTDLLNALYLHLKQDLAAAVWSSPFPSGALEPADRERRCRAGFDAAWSVVAGDATRADVSRRPAAKPAEPEESGCER